MWVSDKTIPTPYLASSNKVRRTPSSQKMPATHRHPGKREALIRDLSTRTLINIITLIATIPVRGQDDGERIKQGIMNSPKVRTTTVISESAKRLSGTLVHSTLIAMFPAQGRDDGCCTRPGRWIGVQGRDDGLGYKAGTTDRGQCWNDGMGLSITMC